jgi:SAM-dependent methyltransferase
MNKTDSTTPFDVEKTVRDRYSKGAQTCESALCVPSNYDPALLKPIPNEIIERDYGCGNPTPWVNPGETVLDLGSGSGKTCFVLSQIVGHKGAVIGVDMNDNMLALARSHQHQITNAIGHDNIRFLKARIQDLALDLQKAEAFLAQNPVGAIEQWSAFDAHCADLRRESPLIPDNTIDVIVSSCVLNLVETAQKQKLFNEMFRVLKKGGRAVISDIVCDEDPTHTIMNDPDLWSGCVSGAFREDRFLAMFEDAGFHGVEILDRTQNPWQTIDGIEFRAMTVRAFKGKQGPCIERNQAVVYKGPWKQVKDDDGHVFHRGERIAVCEKTFNIMTNPIGPYAGQLAPVEPIEAIPPNQAKPFDCRRSAKRSPRETKGLEYNVTTESDHDATCGPDGCC